ncbi:outer membrane beta-barrel protein [Flavobacterium acetivorans]|uniref:outer membrane beta-barrel protein n=1 Tax=Flavobacterium acetivorans TaxID=2893883 RepID=UPI001E4C5B0F|nr:outer membrane beta-barrel protein [Flavobacterium sp. F-29]UFH35579.1 PorT family protein [Flavobacterium sp. F-29]
MKKNILTAAAVFVFGFVNAQEAKFGVKAGADFASMHGKFAGNSYSESETGFYVGGFVDVAVSDKFHVQPELLYVSVKDLDQIQIPVLAKFGVAEKFNVLAGPNFGFILDAGEGAKSFNLGLDLGASYDLTGNLSLDAKYNYGLTNLIDGGNSNFSTKLSGLFVGLGYKF